MKVTLSVINVVTLSCLVLAEDENCIAPNGKAGKCVPISNCDKLKNLIKGSAADRELLKQWHCGFDGYFPKVCCQHQYTTLTTIVTPVRNACSTIEKRPGTCVAIEKCPEINKKLTPPVTMQNLDYVEKSRCKGSDKKYSVCCEQPSAANATNAELNRIRGSTSCRTTGLPDPESDCCGLDSSSGNKIINGLPAKIDEYPWLAIIEYSRPYVCGGSLISSRFVITAAHCVVTSEKFDRGAKAVRLGEYDTTKIGEDCIDVEGDGEDCTNGTSTFDIIERIIHPEYNGDKTLVQINDIALLKINDTAPFTDFIRPICLPKLDVTISPPKNIRFYIAGWGAVDEFRPTSPVKLHTDIPFLSFTECLKLYTRNGVSIVWDKQICAGGEKDRDSCKGDSGGPLMYNDDRKYELTGIISFGSIQCGNEGKPSIYTKVYEYLPWIKSRVDA